MQTKTKGRPHIPRAVRLRERPTSRLRRMVPTDGSCLGLSDGRPRALLITSSKPHLLSRPPCSRDVFPDCLSPVLSNFPSFRHSKLVRKLPSIPGTLPTYAGPWITAQRLTIHFTPTYFNVYNLKKARQSDCIKRRYALRAQVAAVSWRS